MHATQGSEFRVVEEVPLPQKLRKQACYRSVPGEARRRSAGRLGRGQLSRAGKGTLAVRGGTTSQNVSQGHREGEAPGTQSFLRTRAESRRRPPAWPRPALTGGKRETATPRCAELRGAWGSNCSVPSPSGRKIFKVRNGLRIKSKSRSSGSRPAWPTHRAPRAQACSSLCPEQKGAPQSAVMTKVQVADQGLSSE